MKSGPSGRRGPGRDMATYNPEGHIQLPRADAIRSRLIDTFSLIEHLQGVSQAVPRHTVREMVDPIHQKKIMLGDQNQLVRFSIKPRHEERITHSRRLMSKLEVRFSWRPPLSLWAGWVLECILSYYSFYPTALLFFLLHHQPYDFIFLFPNSISFSISLVLFLPLLFHLHESKNSTIYFLKRKQVLSSQISSYSS